MEHRTIAVNGVRLHYVIAGSGPLVVLLHGFPDHWYSWRYQIAALAEEWTVVAPDLRGYNLSEQRGPYDVDTLVGDIIALIEALGSGPARLVGHDWGGIIAWNAAARRPDLIERVAILNVPHPTIAGEHLSYNPRQMLRSSYALFFQLPKLPELLLSAGDYALIIRQLQRLSAVGAFSPADLELYRQALRRTDLSGPLAYYREARKHPRRTGIARAVRVHIPALILWGECDPFLGTELLNGNRRYVPDLQIRTIKWAGHWVHNDAPQLVNTYLTAFLRAEPLPA